MQKIIFGIVKVIVAKGLGGEAFLKMPYVESTQQLLFQKIQAMPVWLRIPIIILTFMFNILGVLSTGHRFQKQSFDQQVRTVAMWQDSPIKVCREFIKFYEKLTLFIYFSI